MDSLIYICTFSHMYMLPYPVVDVYVTSVVDVYVTRVNSGRPLFLLEVGIISRLSSQAAVWTDLQKGLLKS